MPALSELEREVTAYFRDRFGVPESWLARLTFTEKGDEIWATASPCPPGLHSARPSGLRAVRRNPRGLKPTSVFLVTLGERISSAEVPVDAGTLRLLLLGQRVPADGQADGYVALRFHQDILGCGQVHNGVLRALIPTGRRRELLALLSTPRGAET